MEIPLVEVPELNDSFDKDPIKKREDWEKYQILLEWSRK